MQRSSAVLGLLAIALSGCSTQASPPAAVASAVSSIVSVPAQSAGPAASATHASPSVGPTPSVAVQDLPEGDQHVYPGTYTTHFQLPLTFTVGDEVQLSCVPGFRCRGDVNVNLPSWVNIGFGNAPGVEVHFNRFDKVLDPKHPGRLIDPPADLAKWIMTLPGITMLAPAQEVEIGGLVATQLDVTSGAKGITFGPIPGVTEFGSGIGPHQAHRLIVVAMDGQQVLIAVGIVTESPEAAVTPAELKIATDALQPLIDSIVWH